MYEIGKYLFLEIAAIRNKGETVGYMGVQFVIDYINLTFGLLHPVYEIVIV